ncbi:MAG: serpin family protein [Anaerolineales bacterium]|nr:serpin family protein [Anaerolineales bacterium]MCC6986048.1 serpin family protein [Anaerolineales bacterium]
MKKLVIVSTVLSILLAACGGGGSAGLAESSRARENTPNVDKADIDSLVDGNNAFGLDLYQSLRNRDENLILSPFSISLALAMTYSGARGETETQMADTLNFTGRERTHPAFNALDLALEAQGIILDKEQEPMQLDIANAVFAEQTFAFLPDFLDTLSVNYGAGIRLMDFANNPDPSRKEINQWVSDETKDKINDLLPENAVTTNTKMVLVNAIYFKADWLSPFDANDTYDGTFTLLDGSEVTAPMMGQRMYIPYYVGEGYAAAELPYAGDSAVMTLLVPDAGRFEEIESQLNGAMFREMLANLAPADVTLRMPKFEYESSFMLSDTLAAMGMPFAFDENRADFSGMTDQQALYIGNVIHKAFVAVDEEGTEAAAATAVIMEGTSAMMPENELHIDRPFIYFIRDLESGQILFIGRVVNPQ